MNAPRRLTEPSVGDWLNARLLDHAAGVGCRVGSVVPTGFPRVVRVLHPAGDGRSWAEVAAEAGRVAHPLVQWCCIAAHFNGTGRSGDVDPEEGSIPAGTLRVILGHCPGHGELVQAVWDGFGTWTGPAAPGSLMPGWGGRDYRLFVTDRSTVTSWPEMNAGWPQSANLIWPMDRSWCIATEIDWDSTLIAGSRGLADAILADSRLEAFPVDDADDLSWCGDTVNPRPDWLADMCRADR